MAVPADETGPSNWVIPETLKGDDKSLMEQLSAVHTRNTYNNGKKSLTGNAKELRRSSSEDARIAAASAAVEAEEVAAEAKKKKKKKGGGCCGGGGDAVDPRATRSLSDLRPAAAAAGDDLDASTFLRDPTSGVTYAIDKVIGEGGFSKVLLVRPRDGHREEAMGSRTLFAAKIIPKAHLKLAGDSFIKATMLERNLLADVHHPFVLQLYHSFQEKDRLVLIVDFCQGGSVHYHVNAAVKATGRGLSERRSAFYVAEIALGLTELHRWGIVHRDLKLENVLVKRSGHIAICDFGTSKGLKRTAADGAPPPKRTAADGLSGLKPTTKSIIGTPAYMAPEMLLEQAYNYSVDWWALGVTYFTMLRARLPFDGGRHHEEEKMLWRIVKSRPRYEACWSADVREALQLLLQKVPKTRITSLTALKKLPLYAGFDWKATEAEAAPVPFEPKLASEGDMRYIPNKYKDAPLPVRGDTPYKKGDSMRKLFRNFSHRGSFVDHRR